MTELWRIVDWSLCPLSFPLVGLDSMVVVLESRHVSVRESCATKVPPTPGADVKAWSESVEAEAKAMFLVLVYQPHRALSNFLITNRLLKPELQLQLQVDFRARSICNLLQVTASGPF